ncbi:MAG TPA: DNA-processing protein DprA [Planctomycetota bacterium]|nr:DNA-processing protein DprA [Planctomycetota bacterium]
MGAVCLGRLLARFGSAQAVLAATADELASVPKVPHLIQEGIGRAAQEIERHRGVAQRLLAEGAGALRRGDAGYPERLHVLASPPPLFYVRGRLPRESRRTFGIVGTTEPSEHGAEVASAIARHLAERGWVIVSGHAQGVDAAAHRAALGARRPTVLVLPTGILQFRPRSGYPPPEGLWRLAAAVSECHPEAAWTTPAALARNRLIAALSDTVLVVEARERGGALSTIRHAIALGRRAFAVRFRTPALSATGNAAAEAAGALPVGSVRQLDALLARGSPGRGQQGLPW